MSKATSYSLRANPFHAYRDPETGHWVTVVPSTLAVEQTPKAIVARKLRLIAAEEFSQLHTPAS